MKCEDVEIRLKSYLSDDLDDQNKSEIKDHLIRCLHCSQSIEQLTKLSEVVQTWKEIEPPPRLFETIRSRMDVSESRSRRIFSAVFLKKTAFRFGEAATVVLLAFIFSLFMRRPIPTKPDKADTINVYLTEHQGAVLQTVSQDLSSQPPAQLSINRDDILYFEHIDGISRFARPGVIFRRPGISEEEADLPKPPTISKGKILTISQASLSIDFELEAPPRLHPGYILDRIEKIEDFNSLHLVYTNGLDTISLFEQPINGELGLAAQDFREFAIYQSIEPDTDDVKTQDKATILAWSNGIISFVLIGKTEMSQLMDMAQSINSRKNQ